jgi:hypothetical protein
MILQYIYIHSVEMAVIFFKIVLLKCSNIKLTINKLWYGVWNHKHTR